MLVVGTQVCTLPAVMAGCVRVLDVVVGLADARTFVLAAERFKVHNLG